MRIISFFTNQGVLATGLSPTIDIVDVNSSSLIMNDASMTVFTNMTHCYYYDFTSTSSTTYDTDNDYAFTVDGTTSLNDIDRYQFGTNDNENLRDDIIVIKKIETGRWRILNNQMLFYDEDGTTVLYTFDLKDSGGSPTEQNVYERDPV